MTSPNQNKDSQHKSQAKKVLITGCSSGIGKETAHYLKQQG